MATREVVNKTGGIEINGSLLFGMDAELALKAQQNYDYGLEKEIMEWIEAALEKKLPSRDLGEALKSGIILCELLNRIRPGTIKKINTRSIALMEIENIKLYLEGCWKLGVPSGDLFVSSDLYNKKSMQSVLQNLTSLSRLASRIPSYTGPIMASHSRSSLSSMASSSSSSPSKPPAKKWEKINIGQPKFVTDNQPVEAIDLRSEIVRLKQELDRERFDRDHLEKKLASLSSSSSSSSINNNNNVNNNIVDNAEVQKLKLNITQLEKEVQSLNQQLSSSKSTNDLNSKLENEKKSLQSTISKLEKEISNLKDSLNQEKSQHEQTKRDLSSQKTTVTRLEKNISELRSQIQVLSKLPPSNNNDNQLQTEVSRLTQKVNNLENQYFDERTVHDQLRSEYNRLQSEIVELREKNKSLLKQIQDLESASMNQKNTLLSNSQSEQKLLQKIRQLEDQLFDEKNVHNHLKIDHSSLVNEFNVLKETVNRQINQIRDLQNEMQSYKIQISEMQSKQQNAGSPVKDNLKNSRSNVIGGLIRRNTENTSRLLARNYFILDYEDNNNELEANKELSKRVWDCLHALLQSKFVEFTDVVELNRFFKIDAGRRKFTQMLELTMQEAPTLTLSDSSFELVLYLINTTLTEMDLSDSADLITAKILMKASSLIKRVVNNKEQYIMDFIKSYQVWKQQTYWEELFWDELFKKHKQRSLSNSESEDEDLYSMDHDLTVFVLELIANTMMLWNVHRDQITQFVMDMCNQTKLPENDISKLVAKMNNESFWDIEPLKKKKHKKHKKVSKKTKK